MTNSPNSGNEPESNLPPSNQRLWLILLRRGGLTVGVLFLVSLLGGMTAIWFYVQRQLAPLVEKNLTETLNRPVQLGKVEGFSFLGTLQFGASAVPATATDPDRLAVKAVEVNFDPLKLVLTRTLELEVTLVNPDVYVEQDAEGRWVSTAVKSEEKKGPIQTELRGVRVRQAQVVLVPSPEAGEQKVAIAISQVNGDATFREKNQRINFDLGGTPLNGGSLRIRGENRPAAEQTNLVIAAQSLLATDVSRLLKLKAVDLEAGRLDGNVEVQLRPEQPPSLIGTAMFQGATVQVAQLTQRFTNTTGQLGFKGTEIQLQNVSTVYGQIPGLVNGVIDTQAGYNLSAQTVPVGLANILNTFDLKLPVAAAAEAQAAIRVTGRPEKPMISGTVVTTKRSQVDRVEFRSLQTNFQLVGQTLAFNNIQALPTVGGQLTGNGRIKLGDKGGLVFDLQGQDLPGDTLALLYGSKSPIRIGRVSAKAQVFGPTGNLQTVVQVAAPTATYPTTGEVIITPGGNLLFRNTTLQVAGGTVQGVGQIVDGRWQASIQASNVPGQGLAPLLKQEVPPQLQGRLSGRFDLSGILENASAETIQGSGSGRLTLAGGTVTARNVEINRGRWQGNFAAAGVQLRQLSPQVPPQFQGLLNGNFNLAGSLSNFQLESINGKGSGNLNVAGGAIAAKNLQLNNGNWQGNFTAVGLQLGRLSPQLPRQFQGRFNGNFSLAGTLAELRPETIRGTGSGNLNVAGGTLTASNVQLGGGNWQGNFTAAGVPLGSLSPQTPASLAQGRLTGQFSLAGNLNNFQLDSLRGNGSGRLQVGDGALAANNLQLGGGNWQGTFAAVQLPLARLAPQLPPQFQGRLTGTFNLAGNLNNLKPEAINGTGAGRLQVAGGAIAADNLQLREGNWQGTFAAAQLPIGQLSPQIPPQFQGRLTGTFNLAGNLNNLKPEAITGTGTGRLQVAEGAIAADNLQLRGGNWQGTFAAANLPLGRFLPQLPPPLQGRFTGQFNLGGNLTAFKPETLTGNGNGSLTVGGGTVTATNVQLGAGRWQGNFTATDVALQPLTQLTALNRLNRPASTPFLQGQVSGNVTASGSLTAFNPNGVQVAGNLQLQNLVADGLDFDPVLRGTVNVAPGQGINLQLAGTQDRIEVALSPTYQPVSFLIQRDEAIARGRSEGDRLLVSSEKFPLSILKTIAAVPPNVAQTPISGLLSGNFDINLATRNVVATGVEIDKPIIGSLRGDKLIGSFQYANGVATLTNAEFQQGESRYFLSGNLTQTRNGPQFQAKLQVPQGKIQNVLTALQIFEIQDLTRGFTPPAYGKAADLAPVTTGLPEATLLTQLRRLSEIEAFLAQKTAQREASPIPELRDLAGNFSGEINVAGSLQQGVNASFDLVGADWKWGDRYQANQVIVRGSFENGVITLLPLRIVSGETVLAYSGTLGGDQQSGQVRVRNLPVENLRDFADLPVDITGNLNVTATLAGSLQNPQARGELTLTGGTLNQTAIQAAQSSFNYSDARLAFYSTALISGNEPTQITGSIPYQLPFATVPPASNALSVDVNVQNEGLALLNLLTRQQVAWVNGQGRVDLSVRGTVDQAAGKINQLVAEGVAVVQNATIQAQALPEPLTDVTGRVLFNFDRIQVESLQGKFTKGQVTASGVIPIYQPLPTDNPLTVTLNQLALNLKGRYTGGVDGTVVLTGTALSPRIGGEVQLVNGQVLLEDTAERATPVVAGGGSDSEAGGGSATEFNNLQISLGKGVQITRPPVLNFLATGNLTLNGSLDDIRPQGTVELKRGQVNLFTTQFRLARGYPQTAQFIPSQGLVPNLDVRLIALTPEATRRRLPNDPLSAEISDVSVTNLGAVQTVRIQARIVGPANQFAENLELTSNPSRSEAEIVALLGGSFVDTLGRGDTTLGLANLAGSALLSNVQNVIGDALGLSEFRLYPTISTDEKRRSSTLGLAAEAGVDITPKFSTSISKVLTGSEPPQVNLRYRVNDKVLLRGATDFSGDSRAVVEYENRF